MKGLTSAQVPLPANVCRAPRDVCDLGSPPLSLVSPPGIPGMFVVEIHTEDVAPRNCFDVFVLASKSVQTFHRGVPAG